MALGCCLTPAKINVVYSLLNLGMGPAEQENNSQVAEKDEHDLYNYFQEQKWQDHAKEWTLVL